MEKDAARPISDGGKMPKAALCIRSYTKAIIYTVIPLLICSLDLTTRRPYGLIYDMNCRAEMHVGKYGIWLSSKSYKDIGATIHLLGLNMNT